MSHPPTSLDPITSPIAYMDRLYHDMNSLVFSIQGYASLITTAGPDSSEANLQTLQEYGEIVVQQTQQLQKIVADARRIAYLTSGLPWELKPLRLGALLETVVVEARQQSGREIDYQDSAGELTVPAEAFWLREAFNKLLDNAVNFSTPGTPVSVAVENDEANHCMTIRVEDQGAGIAETDLPLLFRPFSRLRTSGTRAIPGSGLGLYIAHEVVRKHHGEISVQSEPGGLTGFTIHLPLEAPA